MNWIESNGGPLILISKDELHAWEGIPEGWPDVSGDYGRACAVTGSLGLISVGAGSALVLADEPLPSTWIPSLSGGVLVRWVFAPEDWSSDGLAEPFDVDWGHDFVWRCSSSPAALLDSAASGSSEAEPRLWLDLPPGEYSVSTAEWAPNSETRMLLHRLDRLAG